MLFAIGVILSIVGLIYLYLTWNFNYWTSRGVPGPKPLPLFGTFKGSFFLKRHLLDELHDIHNEYRDKTPYVGVFTARQPQIMAIDPELVKNILTKDFKSFHTNEFATLINKDTDPIFGRNPFLLIGDEWKDKRAEISPAFTASRIKSMFPIIQDVCGKMTTHIQRQLDDKQINEFDAKELSAKFTIDVVSSCIYGVDSKAFTSDQCEIRDVSAEIFKPSTKVLIYFVATAVVPMLRHIYKMSIVPKKVEHFFVSLMSEAIRMRVQSNVEQNDYLNYLMELQKKKNISQLDMVAHTITFFLDGFETSSGVISHVLLSLAQHKECQQTLRQAIQSTIEKDGNITFDNVNDIEYLDQVFNETLRLYPPAGNLTKMCTAPFEMTDYKDKKVTIDKGIVVHLPVWAIHRHPGNYSNPDKFQPERFSAENGGVKSYKEKGVFYPFGDGPRQCLGMRFATAQSKAAVAEIVKNFEITLNPKTHSNYVLDPTSFLVKPLGGIWINLKKLDG